MNRSFGFGVIAGFTAFAAVATEQPLVIKGVKAAVADGQATVTFSVDPVAGSIADLLMAESSITKFTDNLGHDLGVKPADKQSDYTTMPYYAGAERSQGEKALTVDATSPVKAAPEAKSFTLAGEFRAKIADADRTNEIKSLEINDGVAFTIGQQQGKISGVRKAEGKLDFTASFTNAPDDFQLRDMELFDATGEEIRKSCTTLRSKFGEGPGRYEFQFYGIKGDPGAITVRCKQWVGVKEVRAPFAFTVPAGRAEGGEVVAASASAVAGPAPAVKADEVASPVEAKPAKAPGAVAPASQPAVAWPLLKVTGVMGKGKGATVIINGKMVSPGDTVSGVKVESVANGAVVLALQGATKTLRSGQSTQ